MNSIEYNKSSMTGKQYEESKDWLNYNVILLNAWHDILFGRYDDARQSLSSARQYIDGWVKENPESQFPYSDINSFEGMIQLNEGNFQASVELFEKNSGKVGLGPLGMDNVYFDYFHGLALKGSSRNDEANSIFNRISNENFYGIGRALVRELAKVQI